MLRRRRQYGWHGGRRLLSSGTALFCLDHPSLCCFHVTVPWPCVVESPVDAEPTSRADQAIFGGGGLQDTTEPIRADYYYELTFAIVARTDVSTVNLAWFALENAATSTTIADVTVRFFFFSFGCVWWDGFGKGGR